ncbi:MAG TPA: FkbM family methyltransferase [Acidisarcina sp.]|nr:FkbM family methyltransferase [Acidisarcina sp.]
MSRGRVFRRRFSRQYGGAQLFVTPECGLRYLRSNLESVDTCLLNLAKELVQPNSVTWDIGANLGLFSFAAAGLAGSAGKVFAVEPDTYLVDLLRRSSRLKNDGAAPVTVIPCAVSESFGVLDFHIAQRARAANSLSVFEGGQGGGVRETQSVLSVTLDWLATQIPPPDLIKIDAEGADLRVLRGASRLLDEHKPDLICEVFEGIAAEVTAFLFDKGYTLYNAELPRRERRPLTQATYSTLAVSSQKVRSTAMAFDA